MTKPTVSKHRNTSIEICASIITIWRHTDASNRKLLNDRFLHHFFKNIINTILDDLLLRT